MNDSLTSHLLQVIYYLKQTNLGKITSLKEKLCQQMLESVFGLKRKKKKSVIKLTEENAGIVRGVTRASPQGLVNFCIDSIRCRS